jgi:hypothetical protein
MAEHALDARSFLNTASSTSATTTTPFGYDSGHQQPDFRRQSVRVGMVIELLSLLPDAIYDYSRGRSSESGDRLDLCSAAKFPEDDEAHYHSVGWHRQLRRKNMEDQRMAAV